ncbi:MAG: glucose-6-phosphate isomerase [Robiginitomaculum sp.]|nr:glucose-6-phosphate isomerase [Robiginitomaculum sp.]
MNEYDTLHELANAAKRINATSIKELFVTNSERLQEFTVSLRGMHVDFSRQKLDSETLGLLLNYAEQRKVAKFLAQMAEGEVVNISENLPAGHIKTRQQNNKSAEPIRQFVENLHKGIITGSDGRRISHIVHIGIGGSELGPRLVYDALKRSRGSAIKVRFVANVDAACINDALSGLDPASTLVFVVSKSFSTAETISNAKIARDWLNQHLGDNASSKQMYAITANAEKAGDFGIKAKNIFAFENHIGGRFSLWSSVGLSLAASLGNDNWQQLLAGARAMDQHLLQTPISRNLPILSALISFWNLNFLKTPARAIVPYAQRLSLLPLWLQQLIMESNGKSVTSTGKPADLLAAPVVFGDAGTNAQHAFFQALHQAPNPVPVDFIGVIKDAENHPGQSKALLANLLAQSIALMCGKNDQQNPQTNFSGDRPSTTILLDELTPFNLGGLLAFYEHETVVLAHLCRINPFDQWGVELGKELAVQMQNRLDGAVTPKYDLATEAMLKYINKRHDQ